MIREDFLLRMIQQLVAAIARVAGLNRRGAHDEAVEQAHLAWADGLQVPRELVDVLDTPTLAGMLREPEKMRAASQLLAEEARAHAGQGDARRAATCRRRALELRIEAQTREPRDEDAAAIAELISA